MKRFDSLSLEAPLFGPHLLEASAGTGKTFAIEHVFLRLLLESKNPPMPLEEILTVTFTRAATRELKERIRLNVQTALAMCRGERECIWPYLGPFVGSPDEIQKLSDTLALFDRCQIFTIHGFCYRMLQEFAFETGLGMSLLDPDQESNPLEVMRSSLRPFFAKGLQEDVCPEQLALLFGKYDSMTEIARSLLRAREQRASSFDALFARYSAALCTWTGPPICPKKLQNDWMQVQGQFRSQVKGNFLRQIEWLGASFVQRENPLPFRKLLWDRGTLFTFLSPSNRKVKAKEEKPLSYPGFFDWALAHLAPIVWEAADKNHIFSSLVAAWKRWDKECVQPDDLLLWMRRAMDVLLFREKLSQRFQAVIIDEFQDTDSLQWEIFRDLFIQTPKPLRALYLVGDPKQSIYRFRNADVYTYFAARDHLGETHLYHLDTNFRSSKALIDVLNTLFDRPWLSLPKTSRAIPYVPVQVGSSMVSDFPDDRGALHWIVGDEEATYFDTFLPYAVQEIERLGSPRSVALLVKDRYEIQGALDRLRERGISAIAKRHQPLGKTALFRSLRELLEAAALPGDERRANLVQLGPFASLPIPSLDERGLVPFFADVLREETFPCKAVLHQILEELFAWERREGFSFEGLWRFLDHFENLDADEGGRERMEAEDDAVQVMTLHVSKGLEFDIVFALGLASCPVEEEEEMAEQDAEKLRQLYVAMTRAKRRLYVPFKKASSSKRPLSPMALFTQVVEATEGAFLPFLQQLSKKVSTSVEVIPTPYPLPLKPIVPPPPPPSPTALPRLSYPPSYLLSFTSLAQPKESVAQVAFPIKTDDFVGGSTAAADNILKKSREGGGGRTADKRAILMGEWTCATSSKEHRKEVVPSAPSIVPTLETLPRGPETGVVIHQIFEKIFDSKAAVWQEDAIIDRIVEQELRFSSLAPWGKPIQEMVRATLAQPLSDGKDSFPLKNLAPDQLFAEMEFLYSKGPHFVKGFIDLVFCCHNRLYFLDWKTNWLQDASSESVREAMQTHDYELQAALYAEALRRIANTPPFGGAFYLFVRHGAYIHFKPDMNRLEPFDGY